MTFQNGYALIDRSVLLLLLLMTFVVGACLSEPCWAGGGSENLVVVVNADSAASKLIANHYIARRQIPARNVIYLNGLTELETIKLADFKKQILQPVLTQIETRKLSSVDYIVYSADFPTSVDVTSHSQKLKQQAAQKQIPLQSKIYAGHVSINSATFYASYMMLDNPSYLLLNSNNYYRQPSANMLKNPFVGQQQIAFQRAVQAFNRVSSPEYKKAIETLKQLAAQNPEQTAVLYWLARFYGRLEDEKNATTWLARAIRSGWSYRQWTEADVAFEGLKDKPLFKGFIRQIPDEPFYILPSVGYKFVRGVAPNGMINRALGQQDRYYLSTVLAVTRNYGTTEKEALDQLKRSIAADQTHPRGTFYFSDTSDVRNKTRKPNYQHAIKALKKLGHRAEIIRSTLPQLRRDVLGLSTGTASFSWLKSGSRFVPGAIGDNLTSYGGRLKSPGQTKLSEFIRHGAAGASGAVVEPYAIQAKFPHPMIHVHYARGCSLAESFYQSVWGPFQLLIVGDALCQPWATKPQVQVDLAPKTEVSEKFQIKIDESGSPSKVAGIEIYVDGKRIYVGPNPNKIEIDTKDLGDGYHELRVVAIAPWPIESTGNTIIPFQVNNHGHKATLTSRLSEFGDKEKIILTASTNFGDSIEIYHNLRPLAKKNGPQASFQIPASLTGRGPIKLVAVALSSDSDQRVTSYPLELSIRGPISERKLITHPQPPKKKKSPPKKKTR